MPKYEIQVSLSASFIFDTDDEDWADAIKEEEVDVTDPDSIHDFVRVLVEDNGINDFDEPAEIKVILKK